MRYRYVLLLVLSFGLWACDSSSNSDVSGEVACSASPGTWYVSSGECNGVPVTNLPPISIVISTSTSVLNIGPDDCNGTTNYNMSSSAPIAELNLTGSGSWTCDSSGTGVPSCAASSGFACNSSTSIDGVDASFTSCAVSNGEMTASRTVTADIVSAQLTACSADEVEQWVLTQTDPGSGGGSGDLTISESDPYDYGSVGVGSNANHTFTISNGSASAVTAMTGSGLAAPFSFLGGTYPGTGGTCATTLSAGASCTIVVDFSPTATGAVNDSIVIDYNNGAASSVSRDITGTGTSGSVGVLFISDGPVYDYGSVGVGGNISHIFTVTNAGTAAASSIAEVGLVSPFRFTGGAYPGIGGTCTAVLAPAANCNIDIEFVPVANGISNDSIELFYFDGVSVQTATRDVTGTGI